MAVICVVRFCDLRPKQAARVSGSWPTVGNNLRMRSRRRVILPPQAWLESNSFFARRQGLPDPHPFQGGVQIGSPESNRPPDFEVRDQAGHTPAVEVAFADLEVGAGFFFGE